MCTHRQPNPALWGTELDLPLTGTQSRRLQFLASVESWQQPARLLHSANLNSAWLCTWTPGPDPNLQRQSTVKQAWLHSSGDYIYYYLRLVSWCLESWKTHLLRCWCPDAPHLSGQGRGCGSRRCRPPAQLCGPWSPPRPQQRCSHTAGPACAGG